MKRIGGTATDDVLARRWRPLPARSYTLADPVLALGRLILGG